MAKVGAKKSFIAGFGAIVPFWIGAVPFAFAYVVAARLAGLSQLEIILFSLLLSSAAVQIGVVGFIAAGASVWAMLLVAVTLSLQLMLYGFSLRQNLKFPNKFSFWLSAFFLIDGAYAVTTRAGKKGDWGFLLGAELSMYFIWNIGTLAGVWLEGLILQPGLKLDFAIPLVFIVLIVPMIKGKLALFLVVVSAVLAWLFTLFLPGGLSITATALICCILGAKLEKA
jgi:predicted branched-subunit amino acid permease